MEKAVICKGWGGVRGLRRNWTTSNVSQESGPMLLFLSVKLVQPSIVNLTGRIYTWWSSTFTSIMELDLTHIINFAFPLLTTYFCFWLCGEDPSYAVMHLVQTFCGAYCCNKMSQHENWNYLSEQCQYFFGCQIKKKKENENKNIIFARFVGAGFPLEVWYILVFLLLFFLHKWYILISILIYFESPFWHALVAFYLQLDIYWSFYLSSFCTLLQLISTHKYWHLTSKLDIQLRGLLHIAQKGEKNR